MNIFFGLLLLLAAFVRPGQQINLDPNVFCYQCRTTRSHIDLYANPNDCHTYFQCFYFGNGTATGYLRNCPNGTFWHDDVMQCLPEGDTPCADPCLNDEFLQCYGVPGNCATFFTCSSGASYAFCCPESTTFNATSCNCEWGASSSHCSEACLKRKPAQPATTVKPPKNLGTHCIDSWDNILRPTEKETVFQLVDPFNLTVFSLVHCAPGSSFNLDTCSCSDFVPDFEVPPPTPRRCGLYMPFDYDFADHSPNHIYLDQVGNLQLSSSVKARGASSALLRDGGHLELPGRKNWLISNHNGPTMTICFFFKCLNPPCSGGFISNRACTDCTDFNFAFTLNGTGNNVQTDFKCKSRQSPFITQAVNLPASPSDPSGFYHVCIESDGHNARYYFDNQLAQEIPLYCNMAFAHCPNSIGFDAIAGSFEGYIDEYMQCPFILSPAEINAHHQGQDALVAAGLIPPQH